MEKDKWLETIEHEKKILEGMYDDEEMELCGAILFGTEDPKTGKEKPDYQTILLTRFHGEEEDEVDKQKDMFIRMIRTVSMASNAYASIFFSEVWMVVQNPKGPIVRANEHSDRQEYLMALCHHREHGHRICFTPIVRTEDGRSIGTWRDKDTDNYKGRFANLFPPSEMQPPERLAARAIVLESKLLDESFDPGMLH